MSDQPSAPAKSPRIYLSYRRGDTAGYAGRLYEQLTEHFGAGRVMLDIDDISPGYGFDEVIKEAVSSCAAVVVLIGRNWLDSTTGEGRVMDNPDDFVCLEIATALENEIPIVPVLLQGAAIPRAEDLPEGIVQLAG